jgi:hypothetical protein
MKKTIFIGLLSGAFVVMAFISAVQPVAASSTNPSNGVSDGDWSTGTVTPVDLTGTSYPAWLQLLDENGTVLPGATEVCHPFRGGNFGWTADIRVLENEVWTQVPTTMEWVPDTAGVYMACAITPAPGLYALFGYFDQANVKVKAGEFTALDPEICGYVDWVAYWWYHGENYQEEFGWEPGYSLEVYLGSYSDGFPLGEEVTYEIVGIYPIPGFDFPKTGSTTSWDDGDVFATFTDTVLDFDTNGWPEFTNQLLIETQGCSYTLDWDSSDTYESIFN